MGTSVGTPMYCAPEVVDVAPGRRYNEACDVWSLGVLLFVALEKQFPFRDRETIRKGCFTFTAIPSAVSRETRELISALLVVDPAQRLTADGILIRLGGGTSARSASGSGSSGCCGGGGGSALGSPPSKKTKLS